MTSEINIRFLGRTAKFKPNGLTNKEKEWVCDALIDLFTVEDAFYDRLHDEIVLQNWFANIDTEKAISDITSLLRDEMCKETKVTCTIPTAPSY